MFVVFAIWALFGFAYPSAPITIALNVLSKVLAFAAAATLFAPEGFDVGSLLARGRGGGRHADLAGLPTGRPRVARATGAEPERPALGPGVRRNRQPAQ
jgi:hypothetical protein